MGIFYTLLFCLCLSLAHSLPTKTDEGNQLEASFTASEVSKIIATNLLKSYIDIDGNQVHSPLGVASMLAVLAEGTAGETYEEFNKVFGYPKDRSGLRSSFKQLLARYQNREYSADPSFQTWLYIYRNYSVHENYKQVVRENYFVEVKDINLDQYDWSEPNTSPNEGDTTTASNSKDVIGFETLKRIDIAEVNAAVDTTNNDNNKDSYGEEVVNKEASKFDRVVDDKQYVEKPVILEEIKRQQENAAESIKQEDIKVMKEESQQEEKQEDEQQEKELEKKVVAAVEAADKLEKQAAAEAEPIAAIVVDKVLVAPGIDLETRLDANKEIVQVKREEHLNIEDNETVQAEEKLRKNYETAINIQDLVVPIQEVLDSNEPEKVTLPLNKLENAIDEASKDAGEIMIALESHISSVRRIIGARSLFRKDDIATALSANSITGRELGTKTKMLLFNGLYYRGNWARPFVGQVDMDEYFYVTAEDAMKIPMMSAKGTYSAANLERLNAKAIYLPYENNRYAMLIIVPNELEGLHALIKKLEPSDFQLIKQTAAERELCVCLPKFQVEETSRSESMLKHLGLRKLFSRHEADLSLLSEDKDLHVDELVQFVNVRVDEFGSSENLLSASSMVRNIDADAAMERFEINRPFLYFLTDVEQDFIIASGKVYAPELKEDLPITVEVEID